MASSNTQSTSTYSTNRKYKRYYYTKRRSYNYIGIAYRKLRNIPLYALSEKEFYALMKLLLEAKGDSE
jgi:hypothetical protein